MKVMRLRSSRFTIVFIQCVHRNPTALFCTALGILAMLGVYGGLIVLPLFAHMPDDLNLKTIADISRDLPSLYPIMASPFIGAACWYLVHRWFYHHRSPTRTIAPGTTNNA